MDYKKKIENIVKKQNGTVLSSDLDKYNIPRTYLQLMVKEDELEYVHRGVYVGKDYINDDMYALQKKYPKIIYSHETALYLHGLSDKTPNEYSATVPSGYKIVGDIAKDYKIYYIKNELHQVGVKTVNSSFGNPIQIYDVERTICDTLRSRNRIDIQLINNALKRYVNLKTSDYSKLMKYAQDLKIESVVKRYFEILL